MWEALTEIAGEQGQTVHDLVASIHRTDDRASLTSAIRSFIVEYYRRQHWRRTHADPEVVARDIIAALDRAGFVIVPRR